MTDHRTNSALVALRQILRATEISGRAHAKACGLSTSQHIVLQVLAASKGMTQTELAREVSLGQATVTALLDRLAGWDLIERRRDTGDRRRMLVRITEKGQQTLERAPSLLQERFSQRFSCLPGWEQALLVAALERTVELMNGGTIEAAPFLEFGSLSQVEPTAEDQGTSPQKQPSQPG